MTASVLGPGLAVPRAYAVQARRKMVCQLQSLFTGVLHGVA